MLDKLSLKSNRLLRSLRSSEERAFMQSSTVGASVTLGSSTSMVPPGWLSKGHITFSANAIGAELEHEEQREEDEVKHVWQERETDENMADNPIVEILRGCQAAGVHVLLEGRPGISKSTTAIKLAVELVGQDKVASIVLPEDTPVAELRGFYMPDDQGKFRWVDGPITRMIRVGGIAILDELSHLSPEAQTFMHAALDDSPITLPTGETIAKHPSFWCVATQNDSADMLRDALKDRFPVRLTVAQPPETVYQHLPEELREAAKRQVEGEKQSLRPWFAFARLRNTLGDDKAAELIWPKRGAAMLAALKLSKVA